MNKKSLCMLKLNTATAMNATATIKNHIPIKCGIPALIKTGRILQKKIYNYKHRVRE